MEQGPSTIEEIEALIWDSIDVSAFNSSSPTDPTGFPVSSEVSFFGAEISFNGKQLSLEQGERVSCLVYSQEHGYIIAGAEEGTISVWKLQPTRYRRLITSHSHPIAQFFISKQFLVSLSVDQAIIWDLKSLNQVISIPIEEESEPLKYITKYLLKKQKDCLENENKADPLIVRWLSIVLLNINANILFVYAWYSRDDLIEIAMKEGVPLINYKETKTISAFSIAINHNSMNSADALLKGIVIQAEANSESLFINLLPIKRIFWDLFQLDLSYFPRFLDKIAHKESLGRLQPKYQLPHTRFIMVETKKISNAMTRIINIGSSIEDYNTRKSPSMQQSIMNENSGILNEDVAVCPSKMMDQFELKIIEGNQMTRIEYIKAPGSKRKNLTNVNCYSYPLHFLGKVGYLESLHQLYSISLSHNHEVLESMLIERFIRDKWKRKLWLVPLIEAFLFITLLIAIYQYLIEPDVIELPFQSLVDVSKIPFRSIGTVVNNYLGIRELESVSLRVLKKIKKSKRSAIASIIFNINSYRYLLYTF